MRLLFPLLLLTLPVAAQWLQQPTAGLPRDAQGRFNPAAPAPRAADGKPDLSGLWAFGPGVGYSANLTADLPSGDIKPWAAQLSRERLEDFGKDDPETVGCLPGGPRHILGLGVTGIAKIIQTPLMVIVLYEDLSYRQIFLDGRALPKDPNPTWMGYSIGHWEEDTLVVETAGFNDRTWLDFAGHPHTEALVMRERFRRPSFGVIERQVTLEDSAAYAKPFTIPSNGNLMPDTELIESVCENEKDRPHLTGRTEDEKKVVVPQEVLAQYVGQYEVRGGNAFDPRVTRTRFDVTLTDGQLYVDFQGKGKAPMIPLSQTTFSPRLLGTFEFKKNAAGRVTHLYVHSAEEVLEAERKP
jgi:hypothetical protein